MPKELPTMQEVQQKLFLTNKDIQVMFSCGASKAVEIKNSILQCIAFKEQNINEKIKEKICLED